MDGRPSDGLAVAEFSRRSLNGIPISLSSDLASAFVRAVVTCTSNPILRLILSSSTSGKIDWSETPRNRCSCRDHQIHAATPRENYLIRGSAALIRRSRNLYIRSPRNVTLAPTALSLRYLNFEVALLGPSFRGTLAGDQRQLGLGIVQRLFNRLVTPPRC